MCVYVCMYMRVFVYKYVCMYVRMCDCVCMYICVYVCVCVCLYVYSMYVCMDVLFRLPPLNPLPVQSLQLPNVTNPSIATHNLSLPQTSDTAAASLAVDATLILGPEIDFADSELWSSSVAAGELKDSSLNQATATSSSFLLVTNRYVSVTSLYAPWQVCVTCWLALSVAKYSCTSDVEWLVNGTVTRTEGETRNTKRKDGKMSWEKPHLPPSVTEIARMGGSWPPLIMAYCWCGSAPDLSTFPPVSNTKCVKWIQLEFWCSLWLLGGAAGVTDLIIASRWQRFLMCAILSSGWLSGYCGSCIPEGFK